MCWLKGSIFRNPVINFRSFFSWAITNWSSTKCSVYKIVSLFTGILILFHALYQSLRTSFGYILNYVEKRQHPSLSNFVTAQLFEIVLPILALEVDYMYSCLKAEIAVLFTGELSRTCQNFVSSTENRSTSLFVPTFFVGLYQAEYMVDTGSFGLEADLLFSFIWPLLCFNDIHL